MKRPGGVRGGRGAPPALIVNESSRGGAGGGRGAPRSGGWAAQSCFFTDYNNNIIPPTTWGLTPLLIRRPPVWCVRPSILGRVYPPPTPSLLTPWPADRPKTRKNTCFSSKCAQSANPGGGPPLIPGSLWRAQSSNPLLKMATGVPKVRTLCSKWQL